MAELTLPCELEDGDQLRLQDDFLEAGSVRIQVREGGRTAYVLLGPDSARRLRDHLDAFMAQHVTERPYLRLAGGLR
jgi:hypothetical protein